MEPKQTATKRRPIVVLSGLVLSVPPHKSYTSPVQELTPAQSLPPLHSKAHD